MNNLHAIILAGGAEFGRCPVTSDLPVCLWPVLGTPVLVSTLNWLAASGVSSATICLDGDQNRLREVLEKFPIKINVDFLPETMPLGTAGCLREVINQEVCRGKHHNDYLICKATMINPPMLEPFLIHHQKCNNLLTMSVNYLSGTKYDSYEISGTHFCRPDLIGFIPKLGYCDIKERLVPELIQKKEKISSYCLDGGTGSFRDAQSYFNKLCIHLENGKLFRHIPPSYRCLDGNIYISPSATIDSSARLFGPLVIMENVKIGPDCVIMGPGIIGNCVEIAANSFIEACIIWNSVKTDTGVELRHSLINKGVALASGRKSLKGVVWR